MCVLTINLYIYTYTHHYIHIKFAISTVFKAYLTTFLIDTGYEEPIKIHIEC